jgi:dihydropyrimidinase
MLLLHAEENAMLEENIPKLIKKGFRKPIYHAISRPPIVEETAIKNAIRLVEKVGGRLFIVHLASDKGMEMIAKARGQGLSIQAETCTHYLVFTDKMLERDDGIKWICSPALRKQPIQDALWKGIQDGRISMVTSDDAAYSWEAKLYGKDRFDRCPNGIPGIEVRFYLLYSEGVEKKRISIPRFIELVSTAPAKLFGLAPQKGQLTPGSDADFILFDPNKKWRMGKNTLHMGADWSAYENIPITGKIEKVFSRGELIIDGDVCLAKKGRGNYLHRRLTT